MKIDLSNDERKKMASRIAIYTDGACTKNGKKDARGGIGIHCPEGFLPEVSERLPEVECATNNRAELFAIYVAIVLADMIGRSRKTDYAIVIYSDSEYAVNCVTKWVSSWKKRNFTTTAGGKVKNVDLICAIDKLLEKTKLKVDIVSILGHGKEPLAIHSEGNEVADVLAKKGSFKEKVKDLFVDLMKSCACD